MLIANNGCVGMSLGFVDPKIGLPPAVTNFSFNATMVPFSINIWISMGPVLSILATSPISQDSDGIPVGLARHTVPILIVLFNFAPSTTLATPRAGNCYLCPAGLQVVPSATNVFIVYNAGESPANGSTPSSTNVDRLVASLDPAGNRGSPVEHRLLDDGVGYLRIRRFSLDAPSRVHTALAALRADGLSTLVIDLRDNPGGDLTAALELAGDFLPPGSVVALTIDSDGDETVHRSSHPEPHEMPLPILVNRGTASAAELFAGSLQWHGRAVIVGETTFGKGTALSLRANPVDRAPVLATGALVALPDGRPIHGAGIRPDIEFEAQLAASSGVRSVGAAGAPHPPGAARP